MDLSNYVVREGKTPEGITYMENRNTKYQVVVKRTNLEKGINEIHAYKGMPTSPLLDYSVDREGVVLYLHRHSGDSLAEALQDKSKSDEIARHLDRIVDSSVRQLRKLHDSGICHGSISPRKMIIDGDYSVQLVGYGSSGRLGETPRVTERSIYTAPEVVLGGDVDLELADVYSLGRSLYQVVRNADCEDLEAVDRIVSMTSVIPDRREVGPM